MAAAAEIQELHGQLTALETAEKNRADGFRRAMEKAKAAGADTPDREALAEAHRLRADG